MRKIKISVIIPVYNVELYLEKCLESVINQSYKNIEIIIINDGSTDCTHQICKKFADVDTRISYFTQENRGVSVARNKGIEIASGEWISFVDGDDYLEHNTYEKLIQYIEMHKNCDFVSYAFNEENGKEKDTILFEENVQVYKDEEIVKGIFNNKFISGLMCNKLFNTKLIVENYLKLDPDVSVCEDLLFCFEYAKKAQCMIYVNKNFYHYTKREGSATYGRVSWKKMSCTRIYNYILSNTEDNIGIHDSVCIRYIEVLIYLSKNVFYYGCEDSRIRNTLSKQLKHHFPKIISHSKLNNKYKIVGFILVTVPLLFRINRKKDLVNLEYE